MTADRGPVRTLDELDEWEDDDARYCEDCGAELDTNEPSPCDHCTRLSACIDDMCHGLGHCMHDELAARP